MNPHSCAEILPHPYIGRMKGPTARDRVMERLARQARIFPRHDAAELDLEGLDARDASLALAIEQAALRRWLTLQALIEPMLARGWEETDAKVRAALLAGAAQLLLLDRLPDHAVINDAVEWTKHRAGAKGGGLVNAVLRKIAALRETVIESGQVGQEIEKGPVLEWAADELPLGDGRIWKLREPAFDASNPWRRLAEQTSHPLELIEHWMRQFGEETARRLAAHGLVTPPVVVHRADGGPIDDLLRQEPALTAHAAPGFAVVTGGSVMELLARRPELVAQDATSSRAAIALKKALDARAAKRELLIVDACAGKGTKTRQLAALFPDPAVTIVASDADAARMRTLREAFAGDTRVHVVERGEEIMRYAGQADALLLDVPCSNLGVLARRVEAKHRFGRESMASVVDLQRQIVADNLALLRPPSGPDRGGLLAYATCSIDRSENQEQAAWIAKWHRMKATTEESTLPRGLPGESAETYADGGYIAVLERMGS